MDLPPSYNEAVASAPPLHLNQEGYPPSPHLNQGEYPPPSNLNQGRHPHLSQPPPTGFVVPAPTATETTVLTTELDDQLVYKDPMPYFCPDCDKYVVTIVKRSLTYKTHLLAGMLLLCGCWLCSWIPYLLNYLKVYNHYCPNCRTFLDSYSASE